MSHIRSILVKVHVNSHSYLIRFDNDGIAMMHFGRYIFQVYLLFCIQGNIQVQISHNQIREIE